MENRQFIDISNLTPEDHKNIKDVMAKFDLNFNQVLPMFMKANPGIARVVGEIKDGKLQRDEISMEGVKEFKGQEAWDRMVKDVKNNKKEKL